MRLLACCFIMAALFAPAAARAGWLEAETPHFRLYSDGREDSLRRFAAMVEDYDGVLRMMTNTTAPASPVKLDIYMVRSAGDLRKVRPVNPGTAGFYSANPGYIAAFAVRNDNLGISGDEVLFHEYAHHFMWQYYPAAYPAWYVEGFAEFMMTTNITDRLVEVGRFNDNRVYWLVAGSWLPIEKVLDGDIGELSRKEAGMFYSQSWLIVHWAFADPKRSEAMQRYLRALSKGEVGRVAFEREMGMDYRGFTRALKAYVRAGKIRYLRFSRASDRQAISMEVRPLPAAANSLLLPRAAVMLGMPDDQGKAALAMVRKEAARYPGDALAKWTQAAYEMDFGDVPAGSAMVDELIAGGMNDAETLFLRGYGDLVVARNADDEAARRHYDAARAWFAKAFRADQNYFPALWAYVETRSLDPLDDNSLSVLLKAQELAPQVESIRFDAAVALMRSKEFPAAVRMIEPLAADPHGGGMTEYARHLLGKARSGQFTEADLEWSKKVESTAAGADTDDADGSRDGAGASSSGASDESKGAAPSGAAPR